MNILDESVFYWNHSDWPLLDQLNERLLDFCTKWFDFGINKTLLTEAYSVYLSKKNVLETKEMGFLDPLPLRQHVFSTKNKQKLAFSDPLYILRRPQNFAK